MSKAILILDEMPKSCIDCKLSRLYGSFCQIIGDTYVSEGGKSDDCPLKEMPQHKKSLCLTDNKSIMISQPSIYESGWNDCLETLLGEENDN